MVSMNFVGSLGGWIVDWPARQALELGWGLLRAQEATIQVRLENNLRESFRNISSTSPHIRAQVDGRIKSK